MRKRSLHSSLKSVVSKITSSISVCMAMVLTRCFDDWKWDLPMRRFPEVLPVRSTSGLETTSLVRVAARCGIWTDLRTRGTKLR